MQKTSRVTTVLVSILAALAVAAPASAAPITIGSPLTGSFEPNACFNEPCTVIPAKFDEPNALVASPVNGTIVRWHIQNGAPGFSYRLRVVTPSLPVDFTGSGTSSPASPSGSGTETFSTNLPIKTGQMIGIDLEADAPIGYRETSPGDLYAYFNPPLLDGQTLAAEFEEGELAFNAEIQPPPAVTGVAPRAGSFKGNIPVAITGSDFAGVSAVTFGSVPAKSFTVVSETQIVAVAPALRPGAAPVSVTTIAGTATGATPFQAKACKVPQLNGKKLKGAKKRSRKAHCKVGKVKKIEGATAKTGEVVKQRPKPGKVLAPGAKIRVTLAP